jgi:threonine/homoserine/homoserine lactone efflux protein
MIEEYEKRKRKQISSMRSIMDFAMGTVVVLFGAFLIFRDKFDLEINRQFKPDSLDKIFGVICLIYGAWRIYRGVKKNYFH